jgi:dTDP-4-amino-4,6-dideoxygalactose transaminase
MISLFGSDVGPEELAAVEDTFERQWLGIGPRTAEFERRIADKTGRPFAFLNSGSNSLQLALRLLDLPRGGEVILPSFTWISCANAVVINGLTPVFCDVDADTANLTAAHVAARITPRTVAIMVVHYAGKPVDVDSLLPFGLPIVEDAAHAIDSSLRGRHCGALGTVGIFSFDAVKNLTTGEGGGVVARDAAMAERARLLRYCGIAKSGLEASASKGRWWEHELVDVFPKMLNTDIAAAIGLVQLRRLAGFQARRRALWEDYTRRLHQEPWAIGWLEPPAGPAADEQHSYFTYLIRLRAGSRDALAHFLRDRGIYTSLRYHPLHFNAAYGCPGPLPVTEHLNAVALNLPLHQRLADADVDRIFDALRDFRKLHV